MKTDISLYAILDPTRTRGRDLGHLADACAKGGATILQLRCKDYGTRDFMTAASTVKTALAGRIPLLINDRVDVALAVGADGVHVGREDMPPETARRLLGPSAIIGVTLKNAADLGALKHNVDYGCIGGVFATSSKHNVDPPLGLAGFASLRASAGHAMPIGAIAGIDTTNAADVIAAGADGIAVISALFMADDVEAATREMKAIVTQAFARRTAA